MRMYINWACDLKDFITLICDLYADDCDIVTHTNLQIWRSKLTVFLVYVIVWVNSNTQKNYDPSNNTWSILPPTPIFVNGIKLEAMENFSCFASTLFWSSTLD